MKKNEKNEHEKKKKALKCHDRFSDDFQQLVL